MLVVVMQQALSDSGLALHIQVDSIAVIMKSPRERFRKTPEDCLDPVCELSKNVDGDILSDQLFADMRLLKVPKLYKHYGKPRNLNHWEQR